MERGRGQDLGEAGVVAGGEVGEGETERGDFWRHEWKRALEPDIWGTNDPNPNPRNVIADEATRDGVRAPWSSAEGWRKQSGPTSNP